MKKINEKELRILFNDLKNNNQTSFEMLYQNYKKLVYGIAFSISKNQEDSEDVVQTVFSKLYELDKSKLPKNNEASWLYTVTKNETIKILRKRKNNLDIDTIYNVEDKDMINDIINKDSYNRLISKLNDKEKEIISLKILANLSFEQISKLINQPIGTVKWRYYKSINLLKILIGNLAMFIITLTIGLKTVLKQKIKSPTKNENFEINSNESLDINQNINQESQSQETVKSEQELQDGDKLINSMQNSVEQNTIENGVQQEITTQNQENNNVNYIGIGFLGLSIIFLILAISFFKYFKKYQLKTNKKTSK